MAHKVGKAVAVLTSTYIWREKLVELCCLGWLREEWQGLEEGEWCAVADGSSFSEKKVKKKLKNKAEKKKKKIERRMAWVKMMGRSRGLIFLCPGSTHSAASYMLHLSRDGSVITENL